jgi:hypothetical protein
VDAATRRRNRVRQVERRLSVNDAGKAWLSRPRCHRGWLTLDTPDSRAQEFARLVAARRGHPFAVAATVLRHPDATWAYAAAMRSYPSLDVRLTCAGREAFARGLRTRQELVGPLRQPVAVLRVPADEAGYLAGRRKQALRTNVTRAREAGCDCRPLVDGTDRAAVADIVERHATRQGWVWEGRAAAGTDPTYLLLAARDACGRPLVVAGAWTCVPWAALDVFVRIVDDPIASFARHLTQWQLVQELRRRNITWLVSSPGLSEPVGLYYALHLWGYEPVRLRFRDGRRRTAVQVS